MDPGTEPWRNLYPLIFKCNLALEGINSSTSLSSNIKQQLTGEALFIRSFCYFYLQNLYSDVPLILTSDYNYNRQLGRTSSITIIDTLISNLKLAKQMLSDKFLNSSLLPFEPNTLMERVRPTKWAASALLARIYLYNKDYINAEKETSEIVQSSLFDLISLNDVFKSNSGEAIWQLQPTNTENYTADGQFYNLPKEGWGDSYPVILSKNLISSFDSNDNRRKAGNWVNLITINGDSLYYPYKYKSFALSSEKSEYIMVFRLAEIYLIRSESRIHLNKNDLAKEDLNKIRFRAGISNIKFSQSDSLLNAVYRERRNELFTEWGHRWMDLKRTELVDQTMSLITPQKGGAWKSDYKLYPILFLDIKKNINLKQNPGY
jgi:hypothetical protein